MAGMGRDEGGSGLRGAYCLIGGTTASGKSTLAVRLAEHCDAVVINADSQQLFRDLPILTARPTRADEERAEHRLFGILGPEEQPSAGRWLERVEGELARCQEEGRPAILVGGTGLYLLALYRGLSPVPAIPAELRAALVAEAEALATADLHARLAGVDPLMAARLRPSDRQRILRALEVIEGTGRSLVAWQNQPRLGALPPPRAAMALVPSPRLVAERIASRLEAMIAGGVIGEVAALAAERPDLATLPIAKVHGVRDILGYLAGAVDLPTAKERISAQIRQYAKRQRTFLRHQLPEIRWHAAIGEDCSHDALLDELARSLRA
jgi:tRNA dimethylallyltransferase